MYKGFFEDLEYVAGLFFRPFEGCCEKDDAEDDEEEKKCEMGCGQMPCCREGGDDDADEKDGEGCDCMPCSKDEDKEDEDEDDKPQGGLLGPGPVREIMKCMFDASDVDYDYED